MSDIFSFEFIKVCIKAFNEKFGTEISEEYAAMVFIIVVALLIIIFKFIVIPYFRNRKWRKKQLNVILKGYKTYTSRWQRKLYIDTWLQESPPNEHEEPSQAQSIDLRTRTNAITHFIKNVLRENNDHSPYYCILGGSGMGKSTFVVNLVWRYINKHTEKNLPYPIKLINCGDINPLTDYINKTDNKEQTILILDALDENKEAIDNYDVFIKELLNSIIVFRIVIITCRTQFFEKYEDELNVISEQTHDPSSKLPKRFKKYYVSPFYSDEISYYLKKKYLFKCKFSSYKKATNIVNKCNKLMARPLLLSYIDDLLNSDISKFDYSVARIYEIIIDKWLEREANYVTGTTKENRKNVEYKKKLLDFSNEIALCLAKPTFEKSEFNDIINRYKEEKSIKKGYLKGRSLLNRNSSDDYKFAHKSFMEYLVAKQMVERNGAIELESIDCLSNDMIPHFLSSIIFDNQPNFRSNISFGNVFSYSYDFNEFLKLLVLLSQDCISKSRNNHFINIQFLCDITDNIEIYIYHFIYYIHKIDKNSSATENIILGLFFDCTKKCLSTKNLNLIIEHLGGHSKSLRITVFLLNYNTSFSLEQIDFISGLLCRNDIFIKKIVFIPNRAENEDTIKGKTKYLLEQVSYKIDKKYDFAYYIPNQVYITNFYLIGNHLYNIRFEDNKVTIQQL